MTDPNRPEDQLMRRLRAADPVDPKTLPTAADPHPQQLLQEILMTPASSNPNSPPTSPPSINSAATDNLVRSIEDKRLQSKKPNRGQGRLAYIAVSAAAVLAVVAGFLVFSPSNTTSAVAAVHAAAQETASADSARTSTTFTLTATDGSDAGTVAGRIDAAFSGEDVSATLDVTEAPDELLDDSEEDFLDGVESRLVDGVIYIKGPFGQGEDWVAVDAPDFLGRELVEFVDPRSVLDTVQTLVEVEEVGSADIGGESTTHYQSIVDLGDESLGDSGWLSGLEAELDADADGAVTVDLYVNESGILRQLDISGDLDETAGTGQATFAISTSFTDIGEDIVIEAPEAADVSDFFSGLDFDEDPEN